MTSGSFYFDPSAKDVAVFLGPLETKIMALAWDKKNLTVKKTLFYLNDKNNLAYTTTMTILSRLAEKGLLKKKKSGRHFIYNPAITKTEFIKQRQKIITACLKQFK
ncbi:MAG: BlaI/MecI/CopY family transcriptional regulator [Candidatus Zixiibacteriota bacterium]